MSNYKFHADDLIKKYKKKTAKPVIYIVPILKIYFSFKFGFFWL